MWLDAFEVASYEIITSSIPESHQLFKQIQIMMMLAEADVPVYDIMEDNED
jgi:hypothetical protein